MAPCNYLGDGHRRRVGATAGLLVLLTAAALLPSCSQSNQADEDDGPAPAARGKSSMPSATTRPADPARAGPTSTSAPGPASRATSLPATRPVARKWRPPRFKTHQDYRDAMVSVIRLHWRRDGVELKDDAVPRAMSSVPRHEFVPSGNPRYAYADSPRPIGYGQTISQPYIVAEMTRRLRLKPNSRVLEIGTGSGYQAAVLTEFTPNVYTIEIIKPLADAAKKRLKRLGYHVVRVKHGDGYYGWPEKAPFHAIIVTAAAGQIPPPLLKQLAPGGRMVIPVGGPFSSQYLTLVEKDASGKVRSRNIMGVRFVPFTRRDRTRQGN